MEILNKYKLEKGLPASTVNNIVSDMLQFQFLHPNPDNSKFNLYIKATQSEFLQNKFIERSFANLIKPIQVEFVSDSNGQQHQLKHTRILLKSLVEKALANQSIVDHLVKEQLHPHQCGTVISSAQDGSFYERIKGKLKIELYIDDSQLAPSGIFNKTQKFINVYASFSDIPFKERCKADNIELLMMVNRKKMKDLELNDSISALFEELKRELHELTTQGIKVKSYGQEYTITAAISTMLGDNLGKVFIYIDSLL